MSGINVNVVDLGNIDFDFDDELEGFEETGELGGSEGSESSEPKTYKVSIEDVTTGQGVSGTGSTEGTAEGTESTSVSKPTRDALKSITRTKSTKDKVANDDVPPRFVILDMNHLIHRYEYGMQTSLSAEVEIEPAVVGYRLRELATGATEEISEKEFESRFGFDAVLEVFTDEEKPVEKAPGFAAQKIIYEPAKQKTLITKIPYGILNSVARWSRYGKDTIIVCSDLGGLTSRKSLFKELYPQEESDSAKKGGYKSQRNGLPHHLKEPLTHMTRALNEAGIHQVRKPDYEADDFIKAIIDKVKEDNPGTAIDVITNDADLLPLVDDTVSVFLSSKNATFPERGPLSKRKYVMVTPENYQDVCEGLSVYKNSKIKVPYNTLLLVKMLRGDKSDEIPQVPKMTPTRVRDITDSLEETFPPELLSRIFRYGQNPYTIYQSLVPVMLSSSVFPVFQLVLDQEFNAEYNRQVANGTINPEETPISSLNHKDLGLGIPNVYDELWNIKPELVDQLTTAAEGTGKDGMGGLIDLSLAMKNFMLMDLNNSLNGKREPLAMKAVPKPYNFKKLVRSANRIFKINLNK